MRGSRDNIVGTARWSSVNYCMPLILGAVQEQFTRVQWLALESDNKSLPQQPGMQGSEYVILAY